MSMIISGGEGDSSPGDSSNDDSKGDIFGTTSISLDCSDPDAGTCNGGGGSSSSDTGE